MITSPCLLRTSQKLVALLAIVSMILPLFPPPTYAQQLPPPLSTEASSQAESSTPLSIDNTAPADGQSSALSTTESDSTEPSSTEIGPEPEQPPLSEASAFKKADDPNEELPPPMLESVPGEQATNDVIDSQKPQAAEINENTGGLVYNYPITVPPGRNGLNPSLKLTYQSDQSDLQSPFGKNWAINIPYIERINKDGIDNLYSSTTAPFFLSSIDGELVTSTVVSVYTTRVNDGSFRSYTYGDDYWVVEDKDGTIYTYGSSTSTRQDDPNNENNIYRWMLEEVRDTNENYIAYTYYKDNGQIYPKSISYTGNGVSEGIFAVNFTRESRTDSATSWRAGFAVASYWRISDVTITISDNTVRTYVLSYSAGENGGTSLLTGIVESVIDESGTTVTLPDTTFAYETHTDGWPGSTNPDWHLPVAVLDEGIDRGYKLIDLNGDGLTDIFYGDYDPDTSKYTYDNYLNNGHGWDAAGSEWNFAFYYNQQDQGFRIADVNGDHLPDILYANYNGSTTSYGANMNTGQGWENDPSWNVPVTLSINGTSRGHQLIDLNGDGLTDIFYGDYDPDTGKYTYDNYINNGHGWDPAGSARNFALYYDQEEQGFRIADVNGDHLPDILYANYNGSTTSYGANMNTGQGWENDPSWNVPVTLTINGADRGYELVDLNGDGLIDIFYGNYNPLTGHYTYDNHLNNGHGWDVADSSWDFTLLYDGQDQGYRIVDANADNLPDIEYSNYNGSSTSYGAHINDGQVIDMLTSISHPTGGTTNISYDHIGGQLDEAENLFTTSVPFGLYTVSRIATNDGTTTSTLDTYTYKGGTYRYDDAFDRKLAGFDEIQKTDNSGNVRKTFYHSGGATDEERGEYQDNYFKIGRAYRIEQYDADDNLYRKTINRWESSTSTFSTTGFVKLTQAVQFAYDGTSTHRDKAETYAYNDGTGDLTQKIEYGEVSGNDDGTFSDVGSDKLTTDYDYATSTSSDLMSFVSQITVTDQSSSTVRETKNYYDDLSHGTVAKGNVTRVEQWKSGSTYVDTEYAYNSYGLVTSEADPRDKTTTYTYDSENLYPATIARPHDLTSHFEYDYRNGKTVTTTDPNGNVFASTYDGLGRPKLVKQPDPSATTTLLTAVSYTYDDTSGAVYVKETRHLDGSTEVESYTYYDGLFRPIQTRRSAEAGYYETRDFSYNDIGLLAQESLPYFSSGASSTAATSTQALFTTYEYDALQRTATAANVLGTTTRAYLNWKVTITDPLGNVKDLINDAYGNLVEVEEYVDSATQTTAYTYNGQHLLTNITDALGNERNFTYDGLGRRLTAEDLHHPADATYGFWTYTYDDAGNLTQIVDPKSQTINRTYDDINRILTEDYTGDSGTEITYTYDDCTEGASHLCTASSSGAIISNTYNALGQLTQEDKTIDGTAYTTSYTYDRQGNILTITNPDDSEVKYTYNVGGRIETIQRKESGESYTDVVTDFDYGPHGKITYRENANCTQTTNTYGADQLYRLTNKLTVYECGEEALGPMSLLVGEGYEAYLMNLLLALTNEDDPSPIPTPSVEPSPSVLPSPTHSPTPTPTPTVEPSPFPTPDPSFSPSPTPSTEPSPSPTLEPSPTFEPSPSPSPTPEPSPSAGQSPEPEATPSPSPTPTPMPAAAATQEPAPSPLTNPVTEERTVVTSESLLTEHADRYELAMGQSIPDSGVAKVEFAKAEPKVTLSKWNDEVRMAVQYATVKGEGVLDTNTNHIVWGEGAEEVHVYSLPAGDGMEDGGVEFEVVLNHKPPTNIFSFSITGAENLAFHYQTPLNQGPLEEGAEFCTDTQCRDKNGAVVAERPANVVGSYAVYHKSKANHQTGRTNYATGKAFHIYRPKIVDAIGNWAWGNFAWNENAKTLSVSVPQEFLDAASYPVTVDPTFGYTTAGSSSRSAYTNWVWGSYFDSPSDVSVANSLTMYGRENTGGGSTYIKGLIILTSTLNIVTNAIGSAALLPNYPVNDWVTSTFATPPSPSQSTNHILAIIPSTGSAIVFYDTASGLGPYDSSNSYSSPQDLGSISGTLNNMYSIYTTYTVSASNSAPIAPTDLLTEDQTNPTDVADTLPEFSAVYKDADSGDNALHFRIQVSTSSTDWSSPMWDSGKTSMVTTTEGSRSPDITYASSTIPLDGSTYYWRIKFWDDDDEEGGYSTSTASFTMASSTLVEVIQEITYTYDAIGNIVELANGSETNASSTTTYVYDDLYRLTSVTVTSTPVGVDGYSRTYSYDAVGNITNKSDQGDYTYATATSGEYANPHAVRDIEGTAIGYDENGNVTSAGNTTFEWDYRNRLQQVANGTTTSTYGYEHDDQRVSADVDGTTTHYPTKHYNTDGTNVTKHIFANGELIATISGTGTNASVHYHHADHLGGANAVTDSSGYFNELLDYYPFGSPRLDEQTGFDSQRKFIGEQYDNPTGLSYLNARYYNGSTARFLSQDPVFWEAGITDDGRSILENPQALNSYSYANGNPIINKDPLGRVVGADDALVFGIVTAPLWVPLLYHSTQQLVKGSVNLAKRLRESTQVVDDRASWSFPGGPLNSSGNNNGEPSGLSKIIGITAGATIARLIYCASLGKDDCTNLAKDQNSSGKDAGIGPAEIEDGGTALPVNQEFMRPVKQEFIGPVHQEIIASPQRPASGSTSPSNPFIKLLADIEAKIRSFSHPGNATYP